MDNNPEYSVAQPLHCPAPGCERSFRYPSDLETHWKIHTMTKDYMCETCGQAFTSEKSLSKHNFVSHKIGDPVFCDQCFKPFHSEEAVRAHCKSIHDKSAKTYICTICNEECFSKKTFTTHMNNHSKEFARDMVSQKYNVSQHQTGYTQSQWHVPCSEQQCIARPACQENAGGSSFVKMLNDPQPMMPPQNFGVQSPAHSSISNTTPQHQFQGAFENALHGIQQQNEHMMQVENHFHPFQPLQSYSTPAPTYAHHENDYEMGEKMPIGLMTGKNVKKSKESQARLNLPFTVIDGQYVCSLCDKSFKHRSGLTRHHHMHEGNSRYRCEECNKGFPDNWHLNQHVRSKHKREKNFCCHICNEAFFTKVQMEKHVNIVHLHIKLNCPICKTPFTTQTFLDRHMQKGRCRPRVRKGNRMPKTIAMSLDKPHLCKWCGQNFSTFQEAEDHIEKMHPKRRKKYERKAEDVNKQTNQEKRFVCHICNKSYAHYSNMWLHKASVHRFKKAPFGCGYCGVTFNRSDRLQKHVYAKHTNSIQEVVQFLKEHKNVGLASSEDQQRLKDNPSNI